MRSKDARNISSCIHNLKSFEFLENFVPAMFSGVTEYKDTFAFFLLIVILLIRPSGIVGEDLSEKV